MRPILACVAAAIWACSSACWFIYWQAMGPTLAIGGAYGPLLMLGLVAAVFFLPGLVLGWGFSQQPVWWGLQPVLIGLFVVTPLGIVQTIRLTADVSADPTSHNLWPFEYFLLFLLSLAPIAGAFGGRALGRRQA